MFQRKTFRECTNELSFHSREFRDAYFDTTMDKQKRDAKFKSTSENGLEILDKLALAIRRGDDYGNIQVPDHLFIGKVLSKLTFEEAKQNRDLYHGSGPNSLLKFENLNLRGILNKIAHYNPFQSSYYLTPNLHELVLVGESRSPRADGYWIAILDIDKLNAAINELPDISLESKG